MKKIILIAVAVLGFAVTASAQNFAVGARLGSGFQAQAEYSYNGSNYFEGRFGMNWSNTAGILLTADFTALHNWNIFNMDWTPSFGKWFFDAGAGFSIGGRENLVNLGVAGCAKLGVKLNSIPLKLAIDFTPVFGPSILYFGSEYGAAFNKYNIANLGLSVVYNF